VLTEVSQARELFRVAHAADAHLRQEQQAGHACMQQELRRDCNKAWRCCLGAHANHTSVAVAP
jgi:hypothetical protein